MAQKKVSLHISVQLHDEMMNQCKNYKNSGLDIKKSTFMQVAIKEKVERDSKEIKDKK